jgi:hypothetical protein
LIFAEQIGWLVDGLLAELEASNYLNGKIILLRDLSDAQLQNAYRFCLIFPSFFECWGLPIAEGLAHGKFSVASDRTSIPKVGGNLVDYFDPWDDENALAKIERPLIEPAYLAARETQLRAAYRRWTWADCVHIGALDPPLVQDSQGAPNWRGAKRAHFGLVSGRPPSGHQHQPGCHQGHWSRVTQRRSEGPQLGVAPLAASDTSSIA